MFKLNLSLMKSNIIIKQGIIYKQVSTISSKPNNTNLIIWQPHDIDVWTFIAKVGLQIYMSKRKV